MEAGVVVGLKRRPWAVLRGRELRELWVVGFPEGILVFVIFFDLIRNVDVNDGQNLLWPVD